MICPKMSVCRELVLLVIGPLALCVPLARGQRDTVSTHSGAQSESTSGRTPTFDVTLVKPAKQDGPGEINFLPDGLQAVNSSPEDLLRVAYHLQNIDGLIVGTPKWAKTRLFDVQGKVVGPDAAKSARAEHRSAQAHASSSVSRSIQASGPSRNPERFSLCAGDRCQRFETQAVKSWKRPSDGQP